MTNSDCLSGALVSGLRLWLGVTELGLVAIALFFSSWGVTIDAQITAAELITKFRTPQLERLKRDQAVAGGALIILCSAIIVVTGVLVIM